MNKWANISRQRILLLAVIGISLILFVYEKFETVSHLPTNEQCIASFDEFVYDFPTINGPVQEKILPLSPWEVVSSPPEVQGLPEYRVGRQLEVTAIRTINGESEIWLSNIHSDEDFVYLVYYLNRGEWLQISSEIANSAAKVESLHVATDKSVWGIGLQGEAITFAVFDNVSKRFVEQYSQEVPGNFGFDSKTDSRSLQNRSNVNMWTPNDTFWMLVDGDAVYSFEPLNSKIEQHTSLANYTDLADLLYDPRGFLFFSDYDFKDPSTVQYSVVTDKITELPPRYGSFLSSELVDNKSNRWLRDAYGWHTSNGAFHRMHPDPINHWWHFTVADHHIYYSPPDPFLETSDGRIWFRIYRSEEWRTLRSGIAWFHPETKEGCWFTSEGAEIVEDAQNNLWMVVNNTLYRYQSSSIKSG